MVDPRARVDGHSTFPYTIPLMLNRERMNDIFSHPEFQDRRDPMSGQNGLRVEKVFTSSLRACGVTTKGWGVHDCFPKQGRVVSTDWEGLIPYDPKKHGKMNEWFEEGDAVTEELIHKHRGTKLYRGEVECVKK